MTLYKHTFLKKLNEDMTAGSGGVLGSWESGEYADGDARIPHALGAKKIHNKRNKKNTRNKKKKEKELKKEQKKSKKNKVDMSMSAAFPAQTRGGSIFSGQGFGSHGSFPGFPS